jgi:hypothetical protein
VELRPGIALGLAPRFQSSLAWIDRVQINGGVEGDAGTFYPRRDWRRLREPELALLLAQGDETGQLPGAHVGLVNLPPHVRRPWWAIADAEDMPIGDGERYRAFVDGVIEFLRFKQVPLPVRCRVDVTVSRPGQPSTRWDTASGCPGGLNFNRETGNALDHVAGIINLGDEPTHLVLLNLLPSAMAEMLGPAGLTAPAPGPDLLERFFTTLATYPMIRVRLEAGDGLWLPAEVVYDVCTLDKREVDVALSIRGEAESEG